MSFSKVLEYGCAGGDALASDLMWREIQKLARDKPLIATMGDVAASGGYYMSMAAPTVLAHPLTITGSIGVVTGKFNLADLYDRVPFVPFCPFFLFSFSSSMQLREAAASVAEAASSGSLQLCVSGAEYSCK